jgi:hypothetical protein
MMMMMFIKRDKAMGPRRRLPLCSPVGRYDLSQMLRICDRWFCDLWMFLYRNVPCVSRLFLTLGVSSGIAYSLCYSLFWVSSLLLAGRASGERGEICMVVMRSK